MSDETKSADGKGSASQQTASAPEKPATAATFEQQAQGEQMGLLAEFWDFLLHNKKWWLTPIIIVLLLVGLLVFLSGTAAAPFVYPF